MDDSCARSTGKGAVPRGGLRREQPEFWSFRPRHAGSNEAGFLNLGIPVSDKPDFRVGPMYIFQGARNREQTMTKFASVLFGVGTVVLAASLLPSAAAQTQTAIPNF